MKLGDRVRYVKTHEGHVCRVTGLVENAKSELVKVSVRCECGAALLLNPKDVEHETQS